MNQRMLKDTWYDMAWLLSDVPVLDGLSSSANEHPNHLVRDFHAAGIRIWATCSFFGLLDGFINHLFSFVNTVLDRLVWSVLQHCWTKHDSQTSVGLISSGIIQPFISFSAFSIFQGFRGFARQKETLSCPAVLQTTDMYRSLARFATFKLCLGDFDACSTVLGREMMRWFWNVLQL